MLPIWTIDFESFWSRLYSLSKMSPLEYVKGKEFQLISCSVKLNDYPTDVLFGEKEIRHAFSKIDWSKAGMCAHNMSGFDAYIVAYYLGIRPRMWFCTAAMARPIHGKTTGVSLAKLVQHYAPELTAMGIKPRKDNTILLNTQGKRLEDFTQAELKDMAVYNKDDTEQCRGLFKILSKHYSPAELWQIDAITRMRTEPQFELDAPLLETAASIERDRKLKSLLDLAKMLRSEVEMPEVNWSDPDAVAEAVRSELASAPKFSALLESLGVEVPMKPSPTNPDKEVPALSKTDEAFVALQEHPNDLVAAAARARLDVKSTLLETRIGKFLTAGSLAGGRLPIPIRYCGADTTGRDSGEEYNCFTGDVEVLTPHGWVRFDAWQGEPIMQWWPDGRASLEARPGSLRKHYSGPVVDVRSTFVDATMTPEHRLVARRERGVIERPASFLLNHTGLDGIPASGLWDGHSDSLFTPAEARLMVAIAADGCVVTRKTEPDAIQIGLRRQRKIARMRELLTAVGCEYVERQYPPQVGHKGSHNTVQFTILRSRFTKGLGPWLLQLDREALTAAADEFAHWDGWFHTKTGAHEFASSVREEAEWVSLVWHLSGSPASVRSYSGGKWQVHRRAHGSATSVNRAQVTEKHHDGDVFCASVESTYIFIRRNGKIAVTGQCQNLPRIDPDKPKITDCLRKSLRAPKGKVVIVADQSGIELRVNHFLWKVPSSMALYQASPDKADLYRAFAAQGLYRIEPAGVTKAQRQIGKLCLAEGTLVLTDAGEVPIEQVTARHKVWDGVEWVTTLGATYKGVKDVITYDGVTATPDHEVWISDGRKVPLGAAAAQSQRLARTGAGRTPLGFGGVGVTGSAPCQGVQARPGTMYELRDDQASQLPEPAQGRDKRLPELLSEVRSPGVAATTPGGGAATLHEPQRRGVREVRKPGDRVPVSDGGPSRRVGDAELGLECGQGAGSQGQRRSLRAGQPEMGDPQAERRQPDALEISGVPQVQAGPPGGSVRRHNPAHPAVEGPDTGADRPEVGPAVVQAQRRVWDLLNCGPRSRFTANGRLVSNCQLGLGFGSGAQTFRRIAKTMGGVDMPVESDDPDVLDCATVVNSWRSAYAPIVQGWATCGKSLFDVRAGLENAIDPWGLTHTCAEGIVLPSGRIIRYPDLRLEVKGEWDDGRPKKQWMYAQGRHKAFLTGPKVDENIVQALARDSVFDCSVDYFKSTGLRPALRVHDELVYVVDEAPAADLLAELQRIMRTPPKWWPELVVWSEGDMAGTYGDAK